MTKASEIEAGIEAATANIRHLELPRLTRQEIEFAATLAATSDRDVAAKRVGITPQKAVFWAKRPDILEHVDALLATHREVLAEGVNYTIADAHADLELGKRMAANASEWFKGVELQMKLHGLGEKKTQATVDVNIKVDNRSQLEQLDDDQLLKMAKIDLSHLLPEAIDAEFKEADDEPA